jgi:hypothetical protein
MYLNSKLSAAAIVLAVGSGTVGFAQTRPDRLEITGEFALPQHNLGSIPIPQMLQRSKAVAASKGIP